MRVLEREAPKPCQELVISLWPALCPDPFWGGSQCVWWSSRQMMFGLLLIYFVTLSEALASIIIRANIPRPPCGVFPHLCSYVQILPWCNPIIYILDCIKACDNCSLVFLSFVCSFYLLMKTYSDASPMQKLISSLLASCQAKADYLVHLWFWQFLTLTCHLLFSNSCLWQ